MAGELVCNHSDNVLDVRIALDIGHRGRCEVFRQLLAIVRIEAPASAGRLTIRIHQDAQPAPLAFRPAYWAIPPTTPG